MSTGSTRSPGPPPPVMSVVSVICGSSVVRLRRSAVSVCALLRARSSPVVRRRRRATGYGGATSPTGRQRKGSNVQEADVAGVADDEAAASFDVLAHQHREELVGGGGVVERDEAQDPARRVHRGL